MLWCSHSLAGQIKLVSVPQTRKGREWEKYEQIYREKKKTKGYRETEILQYVVWKVDQKPEMKPKLSLWILLELKKERNLEG